MIDTKNTRSNAEELLDEEDQEFASAEANASEFAALGKAYSAPKAAAETPAPKPVKKAAKKGGISLPKYLVHCEATIKEGMNRTILRYCVPTDDPDSVVHVGSTNVVTATTRVEELTPESLVTYMVELAKTGAMS